MKKTVELVFNYGDCKVNRFKKHSCERYFMDARNRAVELLNPHFDEWNDEYVCGKEEPKTYNRFIQKKIQSILTELNMILDYPVTLCAEEGGEIVGRFMHKGAMITMHLVESKTNDEYHLKTSA